MTVVLSQLFIGQLTHFIIIFIFIFIIIILLYYTVFVEI